MKPTTQNRIASLCPTSSIQPVPNQNPFGTPKARLSNCLRLLGSIFGLALLFAFTSARSGACLQPATPEWIGRAGNEVTCQLPAPATLSADKTGISTAFMEWSAVPDAVSYQVLVYNLSTTEVVYYSVGSGTNATVSGLQSGATFRCTVAAMCSGGSASSFIIWEDILD